MWPLSPKLLEQGSGSYQLTDMMGKQIRQGSIVQSQTALDLSGEANGNYILKVLLGTRKEV